MWWFCCALEGTLKLGPILVSLIWFILILKIWLQKFISKFFFYYLHSAFQVLVTLLYLAVVSPSFYLVTEILNIVSWNLFQNY